MKKNISSPDQGIDLTERYQAFLKSLFTVFLTLCSMGVSGQVWNYDFGTGTGTFTSTTASTTFLPTPTAGTARVRIGTNPGSFVLANPGIALGSNSELQFTSNTNNTSTSKFSIYDYTAAKVGYVKTKIAFNGGTDGVYNFTIGDGVSFSDNNIMANGEIFSGIQFSLLASNAITYKVLNAKIYGVIGISSSTTLFAQSASNEYLIEIYMNNTATPSNYIRGGTSYSLVNATWDLWVNGVQVGINLAKGGLGTNANIDSFAFNHQVSASAPGTVYIDDLEYSNTLPTASACTKPATPNGTISGATTACTSSTLTYAAGVGQPESGIDYYWQTSATGTSTANSVSSSFNASIFGTNNYYVRAQNSVASCWSDATVAYPVTIVIGVPTISSQPSNMSAIVGSTATFSVTAANATSYQWQINTGSGFNDISGATSATYTTPATTLGMNGYLYQVIVTNACGITTSNSVSLSVSAGLSNDNCGGATGLTVNAAATGGTFVGATPQSGFTESDVWYSFTPQCTGEHTITVSGFSGPDLDFAIYASSCPASSSSTTFTTGATSSIPEVKKFPFNGGTTYYIRLFKYNNTGVDTTYNIQVTTPALGTSANITASPTSFCAGTTVTFTATAVTNATSYVWTVPAGWTMTPSSTNVMTATVGSTAGAVTAQAINCYGVGIAKSTTFTPNTIPTTPGTITGNTTVCQSSSNTYTIVPVTGAASYIWTLPSGWTGTSTNASITTTSGTTGGNITVTANSACGSSTAQILPVTVSTPPPTPSTSTSDIASCGNVTLTRGTPPAGETWFWQGTVANGISETDSNVSYTGTTSGTYYLRSKNTTTSCWSVASSSVVVTVNPVTSITAQPSNQSAATGTTATLTVVAVGTGLTYQWQVNPGSGFVNVTVTDGIGGTTSSFTTVPTTLAMNGYKYRVIVTGTCGTITSDGNATLTVVDIIYVDGDFMSNTDGTWTNNTTGTATWLKRVGGVFSSTAEIPNGANDAYTVYINKNIVVDVAATIYATAKLYILTNGKLTYKKSGTPWTFRNIIIENGGTFQADTRFQVLTGANFEMKDGGNFIYNYSANTLDSSVGQFLAGKEIFSPNSNFIVQNLSGGTFLTSNVLNAISPNTNNSYFGNIIVDYFSGENNFILIPSVTYTPSQFQKAICNDLIFRTSNNQPPRIYQATTSSIGSTNKLTIQGDFITESTFTQSISFTTTSQTTGSYYFRVNGNFIHNAPVAYYGLNAVNGVTYYLEVGKNMEIGNGAKYYFRPINNATAGINLYLSGNLAVATTGEFADLGTNAAAGSNVWFNGSTLQTIDFKNQNSNLKLYYSARNGSTVKLLNQDLALGTNSSFIVKPGATLDFGFNGTDGINISRVVSPTLTAGQAFTAEAGSTLKITSPEGISAFGEYTGNVQIGTTTITNRSFNSGATYHYIGKTNQITGNGLLKDAANKYIIVELENNNDTFKSNNGIIRFNNPNTAIGPNFRGLEIRKGTVISDNNGNRFEDSSITGEKGNLKMIGGTFKLFAKDIQPSLTGVYELAAPSKIDFAFTDGADTQSIRSGPDYLYPAIDVSGKSVKHTSGDNINLKSAGSFTVKNGGVLSSQSSTGQIVSNDINSKASLIIESNGTFATQRERGFYGPVDGLNPSPSVRDNIVLSLLPNSTVDYSRSGDQLITGQLLGVAPNEYSYQNLTISGSGIKTTAAGILKVNQLTKLTSTTSELLVPTPTDETTPNVFYALGGIDNTNGTTGLFHLANDAQLMQNTTSDNTKASIQADRKVKIPASTSNQYVYWGSPVSGQVFTGIFGGSTIALYYNEPNDKFYTSTGAYIAGRGLAVRNPSNSGGADLTASFKGTPYNDDLGFMLAFSNAQHGYNLVGNPYPSNLNLNKLYTNSTNIDSTFLFWDNYANSINQQQGSSYKGYAYATYNAVNKAGVKATGSAGNLNGDPTSLAGLKEPNYILKVGQGFLAKATSTGASLGFANADRITDQTAAQFFGKNALDSGNNRYWLEMLTPSNLLVSNAIVYFDNGTNDFSKDDSKLESDVSDALFTNAGDEKVVINGRSNFVDSDVLKVGTRHFTDGIYQIRLGTKEGIFTNGQNIYLKDKETGVITNLQEGNYTFAANTGESTGRFEILYVPEIVLATEGAVKESLTVYRDGNDFVVKAQSKKISSVEMVDTAGRLIFSLNPNSIKAVIPSEKMVHGVYVLKIDQNGVITSMKIIK